ncbi:MAG: cytidylate kinase-like family protein, partial [Thermoanaerobaculia bacterium]
MAFKLTSADPDLSRLVEKQVRNWELARSQRISTPTPEREEVEDFLCVSRMVGVDDRQVAVLIGERLGWPVFDREILEAMAGDDDFRRQIYTSMDQRDLSWWEEALRSLMDRDFVRNDYFHRLCETLLSLSRQGSSVFLGRGADLVLPRNRGFRVRLVAPLTTRTERYAELTGLSPKKARAEIARIEKERAEFLQRHFGIGADDPLRYD